SNCYSAFRGGAGEWTSMTRQVIRSSGASRAVREPGSTVAAGSGDGYLDRLLKLVPTETVAVYLFLDGVVRSGLKDDPSLGIWLWVVFGVIAAGNVLYWKKAGVRDVVQFVVLTAAFVVWVFTIGGPFATAAWYKPFMGSVLLGLFTFLVPYLYKGLPQQTA